MEDIKDKITLVIIGRSGSGKGTQASLLTEKLTPFGVRHMETGQILRDLLKRENPTTAIANKLMKEGGVFPWWFAASTWLKTFVEDGLARFNIIFDGSPRKLAEARMLDEVIAWHGRPLPVGIYINASYEECEKRLLDRRRADDNPKAIANRLAYFETDVMPVVRHFEEQNRLIEINGEQSVEAVQEELTNKLKEKLGDLWPL